MRKDSDMFGKIPNLKVQKFKCYCGHEWEAETVLAPNPEGFIERECKEHENMDKEYPEVD